MTLQQDAATLLESIGAEGDRSHARLRPEDRALILRLAAKGTLTGVEIAKAVGCHPSTVSRTLALVDTRKEARAILESGAARLADAVVKTDDAAIALKALGKLDVVRDDKVGDAASGVTVLIGIAPPGTPQNPILPAESRRLTAADAGCGGKP